jgi:hypothetical protein
MRERGRRRARREAGEAGRARDEFLAIASHELRTALGVITGWAKLLREGSVDGQTKGRSLETIERNALLQKRLIEDLIDDSRITAGELRIDSRLTFTAVGLLFVGLGVPLLRGRVRPNSWYVCRTEKTLSHEKVWYAFNRVTGRDLVAGGGGLVAASLILHAFGRGMNPDYAVLALLFVLVPSVVIMAVDSHGAQKRMDRRRVWSGKPSDGQARPVPDMSAGLRVRLTQ